MQIQVNTDNNIQGSEELNRHVRTEVEGALGRFGDWITRVEVQLTDENSSAKAGGDDLRCAIEARPAGQQPVAVTHHAATQDQALKGSLKKLVRLLGDAKERMTHRKGNVSMAGEGADPDQLAGMQDSDEATER
ncbi:MAG TPA: HPF/RaiA family ribosome-associated protein [Pirellulaceae bacterium]|jgi:hypothetical protein|nr:HPF/RaiA family ribosome-associated protein [Pirellulaceae bacterium]